MHRLVLRHRWVTVLVTGLLLFVTSGMTLTRMTCLMDGHSEWSLGQAEDCCTEEGCAPGATLNAECCAFTELSLEKTDLVLPITHAPEFVLIALDTAPFAVVDACAGIPLRWMDGRPPPLDTPERLAVFGTLLI